MSKGLWGFIGVQRKTISNVDIKINDLIKDIFSSIETLLGLQIENYDNLVQLIKVKKNTDDEQSYFWDWFNEAGYLKLRRILETNLQDDEQLLDKLDYRKMILQLDIANNIEDSYFTSVADTIDVIDEYIQSISQQAVTNENDVKEDEHFFEKYKVPNSEYTEKHQWVYNNNKNPAEEQQDFCYYYIEVRGKIYGQR